SSQPVQDQINFIRSEDFRRKIFEKLYLLVDEDWGRSRKLPVNVRLPDFDVRPIVNTSIIEIRAAAKEPEDAVKIANTMRKYAETTAILQIASQALARCL